MSTYVVVGYAFLVILIIRGYLNNFHDIRPQIHLFLGIVFSLGGIWILTIFIFQKLSPIAYYNLFFLGALILIGFGILFAPSLQHCVLLLVCMQIHTLLSFIHLTFPFVTKMWMCILCVIFLIFFGLRILGEIFDAFLEGCFIVAFAIAAVTIIIIFYKITPPGFLFFIIYLLIIFGLLMGLLQKIGIDADVALGLIFFCILSYFSVFYIFNLPTGGPELITTIISQIMCILQVFQFWNPFLQLASKGTPAVGLFFVLHLLKIFHLIDLESYIYFFLLHYLLLKDDIWYLPLVTGQFLRISTDAASNILSIDISCLHAPTVYLTLPANKIWDNPFDPEIQNTIHKSLK